jgi:hypothetical protein
MVLLSVAFICCIPRTGVSQGSPEDPPPPCTDGSVDLGCGCNNPAPNECGSCLGDLSCLLMDTQTPTATPASTATATPTPTIIPDGCNGPGVETSAQSFKFEETAEGTCIDGSGVYVFDQIRRESKRVTLPSYSRVCSVKIRIPTTSFNYDDEFALTLDNVILAASYYPPPPKVSNYPIRFDWNYVKKLKYEWNKGSIPYCTQSLAPSGQLVKAKQCSMPTGKGATAIKKGTLSIDLGEKTAQKLVESIKSNSSHELQMIGYGNGVSTSIGDCYHSKFSLTLEVSGLP